MRFERAVDLPLPETPISTSTGGTALAAALSIAAVLEPFLVGIDERAG